MEKQTAVSWLVEQVNSDCLNSAFIRPELIDKAKEMERQQIIDAFNDGDFMSCGSENDAINYYNYLYSNENTSTKAD
jgi:hypothetical protein